MAAAESTIQGTQAWKDARIGIITASRIADIIASPKKKGAAESTSRINYRAELVSERTTGQAMPEGFTSWHTRRGNELEPDARCEYEARRQVIIRTAGLVIHPEIQFAGASPDGLIDPDGLCQIKCPIPAVHIAWVKANCVPREHIPQMQWEMACTGLKWNDFVSYNRHFAEPKHLFIKRLYRDDEYIAQLVAEVHRFNAEVNQEIAEFMAIPAEESSDLEETLRASVEHVRAQKALEVTQQDGAEVMGIPIAQQAKDANEKVLSLRRGKIPDNPNPHDFEAADSVIRRTKIADAINRARSAE